MSVYCLDCQTIALAFLSFLPWEKPEIVTAVEMSVALMVDRSAQVGENMSLQPQPKPLVLLVEDNPIQLRISKAYAEKLGVEVHAVSNCREAVKALEQRKFSLILMDWRMPEVDGIACTRNIRDVDAKNGLHTPIVALTARAMQGDRERCLAAGMDDYLSKPFTTAQLKEVMSRWIPNKFEG